jgi:hypothetical protein
MTRFVDLASDMNAADFQQQIEQALGERATLALDTRKEQIATSLFGEEQLDELSKKTLSSYVKKSAEAMATHNAELTHLPRGKTRSYHIGKFVKRAKGHDKAVDKLTK